MDFVAKCSNALSKRRSQTNSLYGSGIFLYISIVMTFTHTFGNFDASHNCLVRIRRFVSAFCRYICSGVEE